MLVFLFYIVFNLVAVVAFFKFQRKSLHPLEIFVYWLVATILFQNYTAFFYLNVKVFVIPEVMSLEMSHLINRTVLYPVVTLLFLNQYVQLKTFLMKVVLVGLYWLLFLGLQWLADELGILIHTSDWKLWWSLAFWLLYVLIHIGVLRVVRKKWMKETRQR